MFVSRTWIGAAVAACALALGACGDDSSDTGQTVPPPPGNGVDRAFINAVLPLHEKAVAVAIIAKKRGNSYVRELASKIAASQPQETARLRGIGGALFAAGVPVGTTGVPATDAADVVDLKRLRSVRPFEDAFLKAMIPLHEATIALCKAEIAKGDQVDLKTTAQAMIDTESSQLTSMRKRQKNA